MSAIKISGSAKGTQLDVKRLYLPFKIEADCPVCGTGSGADMNTDYLSYPTVGSEESVSMFCVKCDEFFSVKVVLGLTLEAAP